MQFNKNNFNEWKNTHTYSILFDSKLLTISKQNSEQHKNLLFKNMKITKTTKLLKIQKSNKKTFGIDMK